MKKSTIRWVVFLAAYFTVCYGLAVYAPDWSAANGMAASYTVLAFGVVVVINGLAVRRRVRRDLDEAQEWHDKALRLYTATAHGRVRTEEHGDDGMLKLFCGCGAELGMVHRDNPDPVLGLSAKHVRAKLEEVKRDSAV